MKFVLAIAIGLALVGCESADLGEDLGASGQDLSAGHDLTNGVGARRVKTTDGAFSTPESCAFHPGVVNPGGKPPGRWFCTYTAYTGGGPLTHDGVGWVAQYDREGRLYYPAIDGYEETPFNDAEPGWAAQCGSGILGAPLGLAIAPDGAGGRIYVVEGGAFDADNDPGTPDQRAITMFSLVDGVCAFEGWIPLPNTIATPNDIAFYNNALYLTASSFADLSKGAIYKIQFPDQFGIPTKWLDMPNEAPNPIVVGALNGQDYLFVAGIGTNLNPGSGAHNGKVMRIRISDRQRTDYLGISGMFDGLGYAPSSFVTGGPYLFTGDLSTRQIQRINAATGALTDGNTSIPGQQPWADLSGLLRQLGGLATDGAPTPTIAAADFRSDVLIIK